MSLLRKAQQQIAHTSTLPSLGNRDLRSLQDVINNEKDWTKGVGRGRGRGPGGESGHEAGRSLPER
jgi:hypothetical protein